MSDNTLLAVVIGTILGVGAMGLKDTECTKLVCNEPNIIAVEETSRGVIARCGPVEVQP